MVFPSRCNDGLIQQGAYKIVQKSWHEIPIEIASWIVQDCSLSPATSSQADEILSKFIFRVVAPWAMQPSDQHPSAYGPQWCSGSTQHPSPC